jgi:hypothetical protein
MDDWVNTQIDVQWGVTTVPLACRPIRAWHSGQVTSDPKEDARRHGREAQPERERDNGGEREREGGRESETTPSSQ